MPLSPHSKITGINSHQWRSDVGRGGSSVPWLNNAPGPASRPWSFWYIDQLCWDPKETARICKKLFLLCFASLADIGSGPETCVVRGPSSPPLRH